MHIMKKFILAALAAIFLISTVIPAGAVGGSSGNAEWSITDGILTVSGGDIPDYTASAAAPWLKYSDRVTSLVVGEGVGKIGNRAFEDMISLASVDLGGVTEIGEMAFSGCAALTAVTIPDSIKTVDSFAFAECSSLKSVTLPAALSHMGEGVFEACPALASFRGGGGRYILIGGAVIDTVNGSVYRYPPAMTANLYTVPAGITSIDSGAFRDCAYLISADLTGVTHMGGGAFYGCASLVTVLIPDCVNIGRAAFYGTSLREVRFGETLRTLGGSAFAFCTALSSADFAGDAPAADESVFYGCAASFTVTVSESSEGFGEYEWMGYPLFRHGVYGGEDNGIRWSLESRTGVMSVTGDGAIPDYEYASDAPWYEYRRLIRSLEMSGITGIGTNSFRYSALRQVSLSGSVTYVGDWAFSGCASLEEVSAEGVSVIGDCAFFGNTALVKVSITGAADIGQQAFSGCASLKYVFTGAAAPELGEYAFDGTDAAVLYPTGGTGYSGGEWDSVYSEPYLAGDASGDGKCNIADVSLLMKDIAGWDVTLNKISADTNCDSKLNITDVSNLLKYIAGWNIVICIG